MTTLAGREPARLDPARLAAARTMLAARADAAVPELRPYPPTDTPPMSFAQERMWYLEELLGRHDLFAVPVPVRVRGTLDVDKLVAALNGVLAHHDVLRTTFDSQCGRLVQRAHATAPLDFAVVDVAGADDEAIATQASLDALRGFDVRTGPLLRARLYRIAPQEHVFVLTTHVAVTDVPSRVLLVGEVWARYRGSTPAPQPLQYADYAQWQRDLLTGPRLQKLLDYWTDRLAGLPGRLDLPVDRARCGPQSGSGAYLYRDAPADLTDRVAHALATAGTTPFVFWIALFRAHIAHLTGQPDFVIGTTRTERTRQGTEQLIGPLVNLLPLRGRATPDLTVAALVAAEHRSALAAYAHQDLTFERLVQELQPDRDAEAPPLYEVSFSYTPHGAIRTPEPPPGMTVERFALAPTASEYSIGLNLFETGATLTAEWVYDPDLFDAPTMDRIADAYWDLVSQAATDLGATLDVVVTGTPADLVRRGVALAPGAAVAAAAPAGTSQARDRVAAAWARVLGAEPVDDDVSFFEAGGHSVALIKLTIELRRTFDREVALGDLFIHSTIAAQAALLHV